MDDEELQLLKFIETRHKEIRALRDRKGQKDVIYRCYFEQADNCLDVELALEASKDLLEISIVDGYSNLNMYLNNEQVDELIEELQKLVTIRGIA